VAFVESKAERLPLLGQHSREIIEITDKRGGGEVGDGWRDIGEGGGGETPGDVLDRPASLPRKATSERPWNHRKSRSTAARLAAISSQGICLREVRARAPLVQPFPGTTRGRRRLPVWLQVSAIAILALVFGGGATTVWILHHSHSEPQSTASNQQSILSLGELPSVLPQGEEATHPLALISREPGKSLYEIS